MRLQLGFLNVTVMGVLLCSLLAFSSPARAQTATDCTVPNVVNMKESDAKSAIISAGMVERVVGVQCYGDPPIPGGYIISQSPTADTPVQCGAFVYLVVSSGDCVCTVLNLVGKTVSEAKSLVTVADTAGIYSNTVPAGRVISQSPAAGTQTRCNYLVGLTYSKGPAPPIVGRIAINGGRSATSNPAVTLQLMAFGGSGVDQQQDVVRRMRFSDDGTHWSVWESKNSTRAYTLPAGPDGIRTVHVQFSNSDTEVSSVYSDSIILDTVPPTGSILINNGASTTKTQAVTLNLSWADTGVGVSRMRFSDDGAHWTAWEKQKNPSAYTLPAGPGHHTVRVQFLDGAGNYSAVYNDYINLVAP